MKINPTKRVVNGFWSKEAGLTYMMILLTITDFIIIPFFDEQRILRILLGFFWMFLLFAGVTTLSKNKTQMILLSIIPTVFIGLNWVSLFIGFMGLDFLILSFKVATFCILIGLVLKKVFETGPITIHRIIGAIVVYVLIGNLGSEIFQYIHSIIPEAFAISNANSTGNSTQTSFLYFSFTTLTTTGFGDILPINNLARTIVIIEQLIGVLFPVVLIGRLVSLREETSKNK